MPTAEPAARGRGRKLSPADRAVLVALVAAHPASSGGHVALMFEDRSGRRITANTARAVRKSGYKDRGGLGYLSDADREALRAIIAADPAATYPELARRFAAGAGRGVSEMTIRWHYKALGLPPKRRGRPRKGVALADR